MEITISRQLAKDIVKECGVEGLFNYLSNRYKNLNLYSINKDWWMIEPKIECKLRGVYEDLIVKFK